MGLVGLLLAVAFLWADEGALTVRGQVVDANGRAGVAYVNVGVPGSGVGTVSDEEGRFELAGVRPGSVVAYSAIGFETRALAVEDHADDGRIELTRRETGYEERVSVRAKAPGEPQILGRRYSERGYGMGMGSALLGAEIGARIKVKKRSYVESAHFIVTHTGGENFLYRVNVYDFSEGEVGEKLLPEDVIVSARQERGTLDVDLREAGLVIENDVLLSLEWIRGDAEMGNRSIMFRARPRTKANTYLKLTSQMPFTSIKRHGLGFYLSVQPIN